MFHGDVVNTQRFAQQRLLSRRRDGRNARNPLGKRVFMDTRDPRGAVLETHLPDAAATRSLGAALARAAVPGMILLLRGTLGAGKTTLVQGFAAELGASPAASPSFVLAHRYAGGRLPLWHLDLYRIEDPEDVEDLDLEQYLPHDGVAVIEWPERAPGGFGVDHVDVDLSVEGDGRHARVRGFGRFATLALDRTSFDSAAR